MKDPFPFSEDNDKEVFELDDATKQQIEDEQATATIDYLDGYRAGYKAGSLASYEDGLAAGWTRGREDILHQLRRYTKSSYDPDVEQLLKEITGDF